MLWNKRETLFNVNVFSKAIKLVQQKTLIFQEFLFFAFEWVILGELMGSVLGEKHYTCMK